MKRRRILYFLLSCMSIFNSQVCCTEKSVRKKTEVKKKDVIPADGQSGSGLLKKFGIPTLAFVLGSVAKTGIDKTIDYFKDKKDDDPGKPDNQPIHTSQVQITDTKPKKDDDTQYVLNFLEIPEKWYNINKKYVPDNSGLSAYDGDHVPHEGHLSWSDFNCWVLSDLQFYFRPELKSTYEEYASKPIKDIIHELDNLPGNEGCDICCSPMFFKDMSKTLEQLKKYIEDGNTKDAYDMIDGSRYLQGNLVRFWDWFTEKPKLEMLTYFYNYHLFYRFEYAVAIKNRCRIYLKMINNPNKKINVYQLNDLCDEGNALPKHLLLSDQDYYIKAEKILGRYNGFNLLLADNNFKKRMEGDGHGPGDLPIDKNIYGTSKRIKQYGFEWLNQPCKYSRVNRWSGKTYEEFETRLRKMKVKKNNIQFKMFNDKQVEDFLKYGKKTVDGQVYRLIAIDVNTDEYNSHECVLRLKYDENLNCTQIVHKDCYNKLDKNVNVNGDLFKFIFDPKTKYVFNGYSPYIETLHFIAEEELKNNLEYYKA